MKMVITTIIMAALIIAAFILIYMNRESEKIVTAAIPLAFAALVALALVFVYAHEAPITRTFPVTFHYQMQDKIPLDIPFRNFPPFSLTLFDQLLKEDPLAIKDDQGNILDVIVYHELLQKVLVDWIAWRHSKKWQVEITNFRYPLGGNAEYFGPITNTQKQKSTVLSENELKEIFNSNRFGRYKFGSGTIALPPNTKLECTLDKSHQQRGLIHFKNRFYDLKIETYPSMGVRNLRGYEIILNIDKTSGNYWTQEYTVKISVKFKWYLIGNPNTTKIRQWAENIINGMQNTFDEQLIQKSVIDHLLLLETTKESKRYPISISPIRAAQSPN